MSDCPARDDLERYAARRLGPNEFAVVFAHVDSCPLCRRDLDRLAPSPEQLAATVHIQSTDGTALAADARTVKLWRGDHAPKAGLKPVQSAPILDWNFPPAPVNVAPNIDGYEILDELGRGGMGVVYKARHLKLNRVVALKMILASELADPENLVRFRAEAEAVASLQHPNIVQVYEVGESQGRPYFSLEYVGGGNLAQRIAGAAQPPKAAAEMTETLARAIHFAHGQGVIHRDLKPANILLGIADFGLRIDGPEPQSAIRNPQSAIPKIADFGLAKYTAAAAATRPDHPTRPGLIVGTPQYMAPEQAGGVPADIGPAVDVYSLGAILYEMLTGQPPFQGATAMDILLQARMVDPIAPRMWRPRVPRDLETIAMKCLQKEPKKRYPSAAALADDLERFRVGRPIEARPAGAAERAWKWARRRPAVAALGGLVLVTMLLGLAGVAWQWSKAEARRVAAENSRNDAVLARDLAEQHRGLAESSLYFSRVAQAHLHFKNGNVARAEELLRLAVPRADRADPRDWEWYYLNRLCRSEVRVLAGHPQWAMAVAFSPDGKHLASVGGGNPFVRDPGEKPFPGTLIFDDPATPRTSQRYGVHANQVLCVAWSADGREVVTGGDDGRVCVARPFDADGSFLKATDVGVMNVGENPVEGVAYRPGAREFVVVGKGGARVYDRITGGTPRLHVAKAVGDIHAVAYSPDGRTFAIAHDKFVELFDANTGVSLWKAVGHTEAVRSVVFRGDGARLASGSDDATVRVWNAADGEPTRTLKGHEGWVWSVAFAPEGDRLASASADGTVRLWEDRPDATPIVYTGHREAARGVAFSPDGRILASAGQDGSVRLWDTHRDPRARVLGGGRPDHRPLALHLDRDTLTAYHAVAPGQTIWNAATGAAIAQRDRADIRARGVGRTDIAVAPDGGHFAAPISGAPDKIGVWDAGTGERKATLTCGNAVFTVAFDADGKRLVTLAHDPHVFLRDKAPLEHRVVVWDWRAGTEIERFTFASMPLHSAAFSPDGRRLALAGGFAAALPNQRRSELRIWDLEAQAEVWHAEPETAINGVAFAPDGHFLATISRVEHEVRVWDAHAGSPVERLKTAVRPAGVTFSPDGRRLAIVALDPVVQLWDVATWQEVLTLQAPVERRPNDIAFFGAIAFAADGRRLAASMWNGAVVVWDAGPRTADD